MSPTHLTWSKKICADINFTVYCFLIWLLVWKRFFLRVLEIQQFVGVQFLIKDEMPACLHNLGMKTLTFIKKILCTQALYVISFHGYHIMVLMEWNFIPEMPSNNSGVEKSSTCHMIREGELIEWKQLPNVDWFCTMIWFQALGLLWKVERIVTL